MRSSMLQKHHMSSYKSLTGSGFSSRILESVQEGTEEEKDSFDLLNFSNDQHLGGMKKLPVVELESRIASSLNGIASTYKVLA
jgi:hypothetical protein